MFLRVLKNLERVQGVFVKLFVEVDTVAERCIAFFKAVDTIVFTKSTCYHKNVLGNE